MRASPYTRSLRGGGAGRRPPVGPTAPVYEIAEHPTAPSPVVLVFGTSAGAAAACRRRLPLDATPLVTTSLDLAGVVADFADCAVVADQARDTAHELESNVAELRRVNPGLAVVCLTRRPRRISYLQEHGLLDEVLAFDAPVLALRVALERARTGALLRRTAHAVAQAGHLRPALRHMLVELLVRTPPLRSVRDLCTGGALKRRTLSHQWRRAAGRHVSLELHDVVTWVLVLRASMLRTGGCTWHDAAAQVGVHRHTLARAARRRGFGMAPDLWADLQSGAHSALRRGFQDNVVRHLLGRQHRAASAG